MGLKRSSTKEITHPPQHQFEQPGREHRMSPQPRYEPVYSGTGKLAGKIALITGGDSGIGRAVAVLFAREGAEITFAYLNEHKDAKETVQQVQAEHRRCIAFAGDIGDEDFCKQVVRNTVKQFGQIDILVNNAAEQHPRESIEKITAKQLERTFRTNVFSMFFMTKAALKHMEEGSVIINTTSVTAYRGSAKLLDYSSTKGAIVAFTRSLSEALAEKQIRVNAVAPGPIWTPLIPSTFPAEKVGKFGADTPMKRPGEPSEVAPAYLFLATQESSYMSGQVLHPNGGEIING